MKSFTRGFAGFSILDVDKTKEFYINLGLKVEEAGVMGLNIYLPNNGSMFAYPKKQHTPATYTIMNLEVEDIDDAVDTLVKKGITFEKYPDLPQDEKGIMRPPTKAYGPAIAWFKDPSDNIIAIVQGEL